MIVSAHSQRAFTSMLTPTSDPRLIVDLSNVCRDPELAPVGERASLRRLDTLFDAWREQRGGAVPTLAIADDSLWRHVRDSRERRELESLREEEKVRRVPAADPVILGLAEVRSSALILSNDFFRGHRRRHPWIQGCTDRFVGWRTSADGVELFDRDMQSFSWYTVSQHEERDECVARGLRLDDDEDWWVLGRAYRCNNVNCLHTLLGTGDAAVRPWRRDGQLVCSCDGPLEDVGELPSAIELVVSVGDRELGRLAIVAGERLELGRDRLASLERSGLSVDDLAFVSRRHVAVSWTVSNVALVEELGSTNRSVLRRWDRARSRALPPAELPAGQRTELRPRDVLRLADVVDVRRSGRRFVIPEERVAQDTAITPERTRLA